MRTSVCPIFIKIFGDCLTLNQQINLFYPTTDVTESGHILSWPLSFLSLLGPFQLVQSLYGTSYRPPITLVAIYLVVNKALFLLPKPYFPLPRLHQREKQGENILVTVARHGPILLLLLHFLHQAIRIEPSSKIQTVRAWAWKAGCLATDSGSTYQQCDLQQIP